MSELHDQIENHEGFYDWAENQSVLSDCSYCKGDERELYDAGQGWRVEKCPKCGKSVLFLDKLEEEVRRLFPLKYAIFEDAKSASDAGAEFS